MMRTGAPIDCPSIGFPVPTTEFLQDPIYLLCLRLKVKFGTHSTESIIEPLPCEIEKFHVVA